jgi:hypothetical protein
MAASVSSTSNPEPTISDIEQIVQNGLEALRNAPLNDQITAALKFLTPPGYRPIAQLEEDGRKKRRSAAASNWNPETGEIVIYFERAESGSPPAPAVPPRMVQNENVQPVPGAPGRNRIPEGASDGSAGPDSQDVSPVQIQQCCEALAEAEKAGKAFISLKWFRDHRLATCGYPWTSSAADRHAVLTRTIEVGAVLTSSTLNPRAPQHPTATVRLNRESQYAQAVAPH